MNAHRDRYPATYAWLIKQAREQAIRHFLAGDEVLMYEALIFAISMEMDD